MTEAEYSQLKKREEWLGILLDRFDGKEVSKANLERAVISARHFMYDMVSETCRYENSRGDLK